MTPKNKSLTAGAVFVSAWTLLFAVFWRRAVTVSPQGDVMAGNLGVWGDWAAHFTMGSAMAYRGLVLHQSPLIMGQPFCYPYFVNLVSALLVRAGVPFFAAFTVPSFFYSILFISAVYIFYRTVLKSDSASVLASLVFLFNGGVGFVRYFQEAFASSDILRALLFPKDRYTRVDDWNIHFNSMLDSTFIPQRAFQLGFPLGLAAVILIARRWERGNMEPQPWRTLVPAGVMWGLLPIVHTHSFVAVSVIFGCWAVADVLMNRRSDALAKRLTFWLALGAIAAVLAVPQLLALHVLSSDGPTNVRWHPGWYAPTFLKWLVFWPLNWSITPFAAMAGVYLWAIKGNPRAITYRKLAFLSPFLVLFALLNLVLLQPWIWDNTKVLLWVSLGVSGMAGFWVSRQRKGIAVISMVLMTLTGFIDNYRIMLPSMNTFEMYSREELELADWVKTHTPPESVWLTGTHHNNWLFNLTGRRALMTYEGWLWTHGYRYQQMKMAVDDLFLYPEDLGLYRAIGVDFIAIGPNERNNFNADPQRFAAHHQLVKKTESYAIFSTGRTPLTQ